MSFRNRFQLIAIAILSVIVVVDVVRGSAETQDPASLDRRISMIEQRFYALETSMNRLQQYVSSQRSTGSASASDLRDREVDQLSQDLQRLQLRLNEVECGLVKLDERTATAGANRRGAESRPTDPCRLNPGQPLRLASRP